MGKWNMNNIIAIVAVVLLIVTIFHIKADAGGLPVAEKPAKPRVIHHSTQKNLEAVDECVTNLIRGGYQNIRVSGASDGKNWADDFYVTAELY